MWALDAVAPLSAFRLAGTRLFFLEGDQRLFALDVATGEVLWTRWAPGAGLGLPPPSGRFGGAGNPPLPPTEPGYPTGYLWDRIWARDSVLNLIQHFIHEYEEEDDRGHKTGERALIFPRYHQLDAVRRLVTHAREHGAGPNYLVEHSAGSGKSNSIAWLAHQLSVLHDAHDRLIFDSVIVVTDRRVLDRQIQRTVRQFQQTPGVVENIDVSGRQLREALEAGKKIIVSTLQKFPVIAGQVGELPGKRFAVIVDEAHSSQSGESARGLSGRWSVILHAFKCGRGVNERQEPWSAEIYFRFPRDCFSSNCFGWRSRRPRNRRTAAQR